MPAIGCISNMVIYILLKMKPSFQFRGDIFLNFKIILCKKYISDTCIVHAYLKAIFISVFYIFYRFSENNQHTHTWGSS